MADRLEFAHLLRGLAALIVVLFAHFGGVFFIAPESVKALIWAPAAEGIEYPIIFKLMNGFGVNYGHLGVGVFYLISGFVIPFSLIRYTRLQFIIARVFRLWPTYMVGLCFTLLALYISVSYYDVSWPYTLKHMLIQSSLMRDIAWLPSIDGVSWTLEIEIKFYLLSALLFAGIYRKQLIYMPLICSYIGLGIVIATSQMDISIHTRAYQLLYVLQMDLVFISFMLIGVVYNFHHRKNFDLKKLYIIVVLMFISFALMWKYSVIGGSYVHGVANYGLALLIYMLFYHNRMRVRSNKSLDFLADISYPLYAVHPVVGYVTMRLFVEKFPGYDLTAVMAALAVSIFAAYVLHKLIENPSNVLGKKLAKKVAA